MDFETVEPTWEAFGNSTYEYVDNPDASGICNELVNRFPNHPEGYYQLGILLGRTDSTVEGLSKAVEHFKKSAKLLQVINNNTFEVHLNMQLKPTK